jgi:hypothetical protein
MLTSLVRSSQLLSPSCDQPRPPWHLQRSQFLVFLCTHPCTCVLCSTHRTFSRISNLTTGRICSDGASDSQLTHDVSQNDVVHDAGHEVSLEGHGAALSRPGNRRMTRFLVFRIGGQQLSTSWDMSVCSVAIFPDGLVTAWKGTNSESSHLPGCCQSIERLRSKRLLISSAQAC